MDPAVGAWYANEVALAIWKSHLCSSSGNSRLCNGDNRLSLDDTAYNRYARLQLWGCYSGNVESLTQDEAASIYLQKQTIQLFTDNIDRQTIAAEIAKRQGPGQTGQLGSKSCEQMMIFIARCLTLTNIGPLETEANPRRHVSWQSGGLRTCLEAYFTGNSEQNCGHVNLYRDFDAWNIEAVGGINIKFTDNLADHLLLVEEDTVLLVFHHASFLECQGNDSLLPPGLREETLKTLALLFPEREYIKYKRGRSRKQAWLRKLCQMHSKDFSSIVDDRLTRCGNLKTSDRQIERFKFWRDRLVVLKQAYDEATPGALSQWWHDRRNGVQWYTFWVAILVLVLTILFGLIQCIEGALQVYKAYNP